MPGPKGDTQPVFIKGETGGHGPPGITGFPGQRGMDPYKTPYFFL